MLYFIESGIYAKIGYSKDFGEPFIKRIEQYKSCNPAFRVVDTAEGNFEDEQRLHKLYSKYLVNGNREWCYAKNLVTKIWIEYRAS